MKKFNKKNKIIKNILKKISIIFFVAFLPFFANAAENADMQSNNLEKKEIQNSWKIQKNNIIKNIKKEIYLNNFLVNEILNNKINSLQHIDDRENFVKQVKNIYLDLDKYYVGNTNLKNISFKIMREKILKKIDNFSKIENLRVSKKFENDLKVLRTVKNQKLFLKRLDIFFNDHIKNFSLRSTRINKKN